VGGKGAYWEILKIFARENCRGLICMNIKDGSGKKSFITLAPCGRHALGLVVALEAALKVEDETAKKKFADIRKLGIDDGHLRKKEAAPSFRLCTVLLTCQKRPNL
jgi:hypothetical protein